MKDAAIARLLRRPRLNGPQALLCAAVALGAALIVRISVDAIVMGCEFSFYLPAIFICAVLLRWWQAAAAAIGAVALHSLVFQGDPAHFLDSACFQSTSGIFLLSSALIIGGAELVRHLLERQRTPEDGNGGIVFSLEKGEVWASWYGTALPVRLGERKRVAMMMADFLAQVELGNRLESNGD